MDDRPPKLPFAATRVVKAARLLPWGAKAVWLEDYALDHGPEGSWISAAHLAARVGLSKDNIERHRRRLAELGLYYVIRRPGARADGWVPTLPLFCVPVLRPTVDQVMTCANQLDQLLEGANGAAHGSADGATDTRGMAAPMPPRMAPSSAPPAPEAGRGEGGRGEGSTLALRGRETTLQPHEDGEVARATGGGRTAEDGGRLPQSILPQAPGRRSPEEPAAAFPEDLDPATRAAQAKWLAKRSEGTP